VPPRGYTNLSVRVEVREELERLREELGVKDLDDLLILLVRSYRDLTSSISKELAHLTNSVSKAQELLTSNISKVQELLTSIASKVSTQEATSLTSYTSKSSTSRLTSVASKDVLAALPPEAVDRLAERLVERLGRQLGRSLGELLAEAVGKALARQAELLEGVSAKLDRLAEARYEEVGERTVPEGFGAAIAGRLKPYLVDRRPVLALVAELARGRRASVPEAELSRAGLVARQVAEASGGALVYTGSSVTLSPLLRAVLEACGCAEEFARELES